MIRLLPILFCFPLISFPSMLETCYKVFFWFVPVADSCVIYIKDGNEIHIKSWAKTATLARMVKPVDSWGEVFMEDMAPVRFFLSQKEGSFMRDHYYEFMEDGISFRMVRKKEKGNEIKEGFFPTQETLYDPFSATFLLYVNTPFEGKRAVKLFYEGKVQRIEYAFAGEEEVEVYTKVYRAWKILLLPKVKTKSLLKPTGEWFVWIDKETNIPVKLKVSFNVGSAIVLLKEVRGNKNFFKEVKNGQVGVF